MSENIARNMYSSQGIKNYPTQLHFTGHFRKLYNDEQNHGYQIDALLRCIKVKLSLWSTYSHKGNWRYNSTRLDFDTRWTNMIIFTSGRLASGERESGTTSIGAGRPRIQHGRFGREKNLLSLGWIETLLLRCPSRTILITPTELYHFLCYA
jgi:hypothetical protein